MLIWIILQAFIPVRCMMPSIIQGHVIDGDKSDCMWTGFHCTRHGKVAKTNIWYSDFILCTGGMVTPGLLLPFLLPAVDVVESTMLSVLWIAFFALLVIRNGVEGAVSDVKSICSKPFSYCEGLLIEKDSQTIEAECVLCAGFILEGSWACSHQKDWWPERGNKRVGGIPQQIRTKKRQIHSF